VKVFAGCPLACVIRFIRTDLVSGRIHLKS